MLFIILTHTHLSRTGCRFVLADDRDNPTTVQLPPRPIPDPCKYKHNTMLLRLVGLLYLLLSIYQSCNPSEFYQQIRYKSGKTQFYLLFRNVPAKCAKL